MADEFIPYTKTCLRCDKEFTVSRPQNVHQKFCSANCRKRFNEQTQEIRRWQPLDHAYTELLDKYNKALSAQRSLKEIIEEKDAAIDSYKKLYDSMIYIIPGMSADGYLTLNEDNPFAQHWHKQMDESPINWWPILHGQRPGITLKREPIPIDPEIIGRVVKDKDPDLQDQQTDNTIPADLYDIKSVDWDDEDFDIDHIDWSD
ncbi:hypothetical protein ACFQY8_07765 [Alloscardovia venturai]|uniref:DNA-binding protein n=1 Tax=Alloscardovia venturai TaxID=1769421 RepID=A0ABW2Y5T8_9BIFI